MPLKKLAATAVDSSVSQSFGMRNRIINGAMMIDQRNAGNAVNMAAAGVTYGVDRWWSYEDTDGTMTMQQSGEAPPGFSRSLVCTVTSADTSLTMMQRVVIAQTIEGNNLADAAYGSASAATFTLSFWVRCSLTGTFGGAFKNSTRSYPFTYTISSANTWEYKTITVTGDQTTTMSVTNLAGMTINFGLGVGSFYSTTAGAWTTGDYNSATGATSVIGTNGATFYITGVQLEKGSVATPFEWRSYGAELALCKRYFQLCSSLFGNAGGSTTFYSIFQFPVEMRAAPTATLTAALNVTFPGVAGYTQSSVNIGAATSSSTTGAFLSFGNFTGMTAGNPIGFNGNSQYVLLNAEL